MEHQSGGIWNEGLGTGNGNDLQRREIKCMYPTIGLLISNSNIFYANLGVSNSNGLEIFIAYTQAVMSSGCFGITTDKRLHSFQIKYQNFM